MPVGFRRIIAEKTGLAPGQQQTVILPLPNEGVSSYFSHLEYRAETYRALIYRVNPDHYISPIWLGHHAF
jgi:hypothetical protein